MMVFANSVTNIAKGKRSIKVHTNACATNLEAPHHYNTDYF